MKVFSRSRETLDPTPDIRALFVTFNDKFFSGRLSCVELEWSRKMYQCAGICYSRRNQMGMACVIRLSEPLLKLRSRKDLIETLLHEMIHAWNFIRGIMEENGGHGQNFLAKMHDINRLAGTNITVYHTFIDEVNEYKNHWWRCDGVCKDRAPFYGFVKRTCNRAPGSNDRWFAQHQQTCGGKFIKVKEPEKKTKGKENKQKVVAPSPKNAKPSPGSDIRKFFKPTSDKESDISSPTSAIKGSPDTKPVPSPSSSGHTLGGMNNGRSRLLDMFDEKRKKTDKENSSKKRKQVFNDDDPDTSAKVIVIDDSFTSSTRDRNSFHDSIKQEIDGNDDDIVFIDDEFDDNYATPSTATKTPEIAPKPSDTCHCPCCNVPIEIAQINIHLDKCLGI